MMARNIAIDEAAKIIGRLITAIPPSERDANCVDDAVRWLRNNASPDLFLPTLIRDMIEARHD